MSSGGAVRRADVGGSQIVRSVGLDIHNQFDIHLYSDQIIDMHTLSIIWFISLSPFCSSFPLCTVRYFELECAVHIWNPTAFLFAV